MLCYIYEIFILFSYKTDFESYCKYIKYKCVANNFEWIIIKIRIDSRYLKQDNLKLTTFLCNHAILNLMMIYLFF